MYFNFRKVLISNLFTIIMFGIDELMGMIATEAVEKFGVGNEISRGESLYNSLEGLTSMRYQLRLVRDEDGKMEWKD